jgi:hypothetical protein
LGIEDTGTGVTGTGGLLLGAGDSGVPNVGKGETGKLVAGPGVDGVGGRDDWSDRVQKLTSSAPISNSCTNASSRRCCCFALYRFICPFCLLRRNRDRPVLCSSAAAVANSAPVAERHAATIITDFRPMFNCYITYPLVVFITLQYHSIINQARSRMKASYRPPSASSYGAEKSPNMWRQWHIHLEKVRKRARKIRRVREIDILLVLFRILRN